MPKKTLYEEFREYLISQGHPVGKEYLLKDYTAKTEIDEEERTVTAVISTDVVDRDKEVLIPKGVDFNSYEKNPVVLWAHSYSDPPIGRALWIKSGRKGITAKLKFAVTEKAEEVYQLFKGKFLKAFSVGFIPTKSHEPKPEDIKKRPEWAEAQRIIDEWELLEFSAVPVPANPEALTIAVKSKEVDLSDDTIKELGIDDITVFLDEPDNSTNDEKLEIKIEDAEMIGEEAVLKPYPNEHACRLKTPNYDKYARKNCEQKHDGKCIDVIYGIKGGKSEIQALRYPKKIWDVAAARSHCKSRGGSFEAAKSSVIIPHRMTYQHRKLKKPPIIISRKDTIDLVVKRMKGRMY
jgi:HK97 family phage prohead protease